MSDRSLYMSPAGFHVSPQWIAFGVLLGLLTFTAAATLYPVLWHVAGLVIVVAVGIVATPLERARRDDTVHTAFLSKPRPVGKSDQRRRLAGASLGC